MTSTTIRINTKDLGDEFIKSLKALFNNKDIEINVNEVIDETEYLLSSRENKKHLQQSIKQFKAGETVSFSNKEFDKVSASLMKSKPASKNQK